MVIASLYAVFVFNCCFLLFVKNANKQTKILNIFSWPQLGRWIFYPIVGLTLQLMLTWAKTQKFASKLQHNCTHCTPVFCCSKNHTDKTALRLSLSFIFTLNLTVQLITTLLRFSWFCLISDSLFAHLQGGQTMKGKKLQTRADACCIEPTLHRQRDNAFYGHVLTMGSQGECSFYSQRQFVEQLCCALRICLT